MIREDRAFSLNDETYQFRCVLFGLASSSLCLKLAQLRQLEVHIIDDILILAESWDNTLTNKAPLHSLRIKINWRVYTYHTAYAIGLMYLLENVGFVANKAKCQLQPTQTIQLSASWSFNHPRAEPAKWKNQEDSELRHGPYWRTGRCQYESCHKSWENSRLRHKQFSSFPFSSASFRCWGVVWIYQGKINQGSCRKK